MYNLPRNSIPKKLLCLVGFSDSAVKVVLGWIRITLASKLVVDEGIGSFQTGSNGRAGSILVQPDLHDVVPPADFDLGFANAWSLPREAYLEGSESAAINLQAVEDALYGIEQEFSSTLENHCSQTQEDFAGAQRK